MKWDRALYFVLVGLYLILAVAALSAGLNSWDEETDYLGIRTQVAHALLLLKGDQPDYRDIHSNLEYYGTVGLFPSWLFWFFGQSLLVGRLTIQQALFDPAAEHQLTGFYFISHVFLALEFILLSGLAISISQSLCHRFAWLAGCFTLITPSLLGHSFVNPKDLPFALFYTAYTLTLVKRFESGKSRWLSFSLLSAALLVNQKFVAIAPVLLSEILLFCLQRQPLRSVIRSAVVPVGSLSIALLLQPASWGILPWVYLREAFETFAHHEWGGCMWWGGSCIGVNQSGWNTAIYIWNWLSIKLPAVIILLAIVQLAFLINRIIAKNDLSRHIRSAWWLILAQLCFIPGLAILRQSNLYDADRHFLFIYPVLAIIAASGVETLLNLQGNRRVRSSLLMLTAALSLLLILDNLAINPYQSAYLNESGRWTHNHLTTSLDYWSVSAKESIRQAQLNGRLPLNPIVEDNLSTLPLFIGHRQLAGHVLKDAKTSIRFQIRNPTEFYDIPNCSLGSEVSRRLATGQNLVMSRLLICS